MENSNSDGELHFCYGCMRQLERDGMVCPACGYDNSHLHNDVDELPEGSILAGKYLVGRRLGRGGFGITYLGFDFTLEIKVAIKEFYFTKYCTRSPQTHRVSTISSGESATHTKARESFQKEALTLARFDNPNIVRVRDFLEENGTAYIVMNYVEGHDLEKEIKQKQRIPWQRVISLFNPLIKELDSLHKEHLIHRDIKPANIKVAPAEPGRPEHLVLMDFGSARTFLADDKTGHFTAYVTQGYAPLEQFSSSSHQGPYTDVYALCATIYFAISGSVPPSSTDMMGSDLKLEPFRTYGIDVPEYIEKAIFHGMALRAKDRTQTMQMLYNELNPADKAETLRQTKAEETTGTSAAKADTGHEPVHHKEAAEKPDDSEPEKPAAADPVNQKEKKEPEKDEVQKRHEQRREMDYTAALRSMKLDTYSGYKQALTLLTGIKGYKDADQQAETCHRRIYELEHPPVPPKKKSSLPLILILLGLCAAGFFILRSINRNSSTGGTAAVRTPTAAASKTPASTAAMTPAEMARMGEKAYDSGDYTGALLYLIPAADAGNSSAQFRLGYMYANGEGVTQSKQTAVSYYKLAAEQGNAAAQSNLGVLYYNGEGVTQSYEMAAYYFKLAADQENTIARFNLGYLYEKGEGVEQSYEQAMYYYRLAADQGHEKAAERLASLENSIGTAAPTPSPTPHFSRSASGTPTPTTETSWATVSLSGGTYLRSHPVISNDTVIRSIPYGERVTLTGGRKTVDGRAWYPVTWNGYEGWVLLDHITLSSNVGTR